MALVLADRVNETTTTAGTGTITLAGAVSGYQSFSAIGNGNTTYYTISHQTAAEWEVGIGTYTSSGTTLSRDTVLASSSGGAKVNFSAGTKNVFCDYPAGKAIYGDANNNVSVTGNLTVGNGIHANSATISSSYTIASGTNGFSVGPITISSGASVTVTTGQKWVVI
jgi:hypothetical protein